jgi:c-di-GMP-binding flagellar brake protein YcgR
MVLDKRQFHRVRFTAISELINNNITYRGQLENISLNGALVSFSDGVIVPQDDECILSVFLEGEDTPLRFVVKVIYSNFTMIGIKFVSEDTETRERLYNILARLSTEKQKLAYERKALEKERE